QPARRPGLDRHVGDLVLDRLELADRLAELLPFPRIGDRVVERALGQPDRLRADPNPSAVERLHGDPESLAFLAETVAFVDKAIFEVDFGARRAVQPHLLEARPNVEPGIVT